MNQIQNSDINSRGKFVSDSPFLTFYGHETRLIGNSVTVFHPQLIIIRPYPGTGRDRRQPATIQPQVGPPAATADKPVPPVAPPLPKRVVRTLRAAAAPLHKHKP
jgi:hypothetical protein